MTFGVDFGAIGRPSFGPGRKPEEENDARSDAQEGKAGQSFLRKVTARRLLAVKRAAEVLTALPAEGESLHCLLLGYFDLLNVVLAFLDREGEAVALRIGTLSLSERNVAELAALLDAGTVKALDVLTSDFQAKHDGEILAYALAELSAARGQRVAAARSHCKVITILMSDGRAYVIEGSANLRTSRNQEQFCLSRDRPLYDFYDQWLQDVVTRHALGQPDGGAAGQ